MRAVKLVCCVAAASCLVVSAHAQASSVALSGYLRLDKRFVVETAKGKLVYPGVPQYPIYHQAYLQLLAAPSDNIDVKLSAALRYYDFMVAKNLYGLQKSQDEFPLQALLWDAYVDLYSLGTDRLDVRIGKQRIAWGTADRFNPTDNLNPLDLTDFFALGERVPTWALKADFVIIEERLRLTGVFLPAPAAALLPRYAQLPFTSLIAGSLPTSMPGFENVPVTVGQTTVDFATPAYNLRHTMQAVKAAGTLAGIDWSVSYFHGYGDLPVPTHVKIKLTSLSPIVIDAQAQTKLPEEQVLGADLAGELFTVGWWAEAAYFFPKKVMTTYDFDLMHIPATQALSDEPYLKYTVGLDYTLPWGTYINFQFIQGFLTERGADQLHHYFMLTLRHKFLHDALVLQAAGMWEVDSFRRIGKDYGLALTPQLTWKPYDDVDLTIGYLGVYSHATPGHPLTLNLYKDDQAYVRCKVSF